MGRIRNNGLCFRESFCYMVVALIKRHTVMDIFGDNHCF